MVDEIDDRFRPTIEPDFYQRIEITTNADRKCMLVQLAIELILEVHSNQSWIDRAIHSVNKKRKNRMSLIDHRSLLEKI